MKHISLFEEWVSRPKTGIILEHYTGLEYPGPDEWDSTVRASRDYLRSKGVDPTTIDYWLRPESPTEHQENIHIPFVYNEAILGKEKFNFDFVPDFDPKSVKLSSQTKQEREKKFQRSLQTGTPYFKGIAINGSTPQERLRDITDSTKKFIEGKDSPAVTLIDLGGDLIVADGAHRIWLAQRLGLPLKAYVVTPESKR